MEKVCYNVILIFHCEFVFDLYLYLPTSCLPIHPSFYVHLAAIQIKAYRVITIDNDRLAIYLSLERSLRLFQGARFAALHFIQK